MKHTRAGGLVPPLYQLGLCIELEIQSSRICAEMESDGVAAKSVFPDLRFSVPQLMSTLLTNGRYDLGRGHLVVPENIRPRFAPSPTPKRTRIEIYQGKPFFDGGRIVNLLADLVSGTPTIPWVEFKNDMTGGVIRIDPWKDLEFHLTY